MSAPASSTAIEPTLPSATDDSSDTVTDSTTAADGEDPSCVFFKPRSRSSNSNKGRKRGRSDIETDTTDDTTIVRPEKQQKKSLTSYSTTKSSVPTEEMTSDPVVGFAFESSQTAKPAGSDDMGATRTLVIDSAPGKGVGRFGPQKVAGNVRISCRFDYQPDICKDYKETGYCGYGDACKFLHDRGDYKTGWQIDKEWEEQQRARVDVRALDNPEEEEIDDLPFACFICRENFKEPVITKCGHYFCERCAVSNHAKTKKCAACGEKTGGIFNKAHKLIARIKERRAKSLAEEEEERKKKAAADADGGDDGDDEGNGHSR